MRPDEHQRQDAERWTEAVQIRNVINEERVRVRSEAKASRATSSVSEQW